MRSNKGEILGSAVEYIKTLKKDQKKLYDLREKLTAYDLRKQRMLTTIFRLELQLKLMGFSKDLQSGKSKKGKHMVDCLADIDDFVKCLPSGSVLNPNEFGTCIFHNDMPTRSQISSSSFRSASLKKRKQRESTIRSCIKTPQNSAPQKETVKYARPNCPKIDIKTKKAHKHQEKNCLEKHSFEMFEGLLEGSHFNEDTF